MEERKTRRRKKRRSSKVKETVAIVALVGVTLFPFVYYLIWRVGQKRHLEPKQILIATSVIWVAAMFTFLMILRDRRKNKTNTSQRPTIGTDYSDAPEEE